MHSSTTNPNKSKENFIPSKLTAIVSIPPAGFLLGADGVGKALGCEAERGEWSFQFSGFMAFETRVLTAATIAFGWPSGSINGEDGCLRPRADASRS